jgi:hypothetical protein
MDISILNIVIWIWKFDISILEFLNFNSTNLSDLEIDIWILNYYFRILKLLFQFKNNYWV